MSVNDSEFFSTTANCYGYAAKDKSPTNPGNGSIVPNGVFFKGDFRRYLLDLREGVLADGGDKVGYLSECPTASLTAAAIPTPRAGWYLTALLVQPSGFHFIRRQKSRVSGAEPTWKWVQGNGGFVRRHAWDVTTKLVEVTNDNLHQLVSVSGNLTGLEMSNVYTHIAFFEVHKDGFKVAAYKP